jgi:hypothetical protein
MRKYGGFVPGIRPGKRTAEYIDTILTRVTLAGAVYLALIAILPDFLITGFRVAPIPVIGEWLDAALPRFITEGMGVTFYFGGTTLLIIVGVAMDTIQQVESQLSEALRRLHEENPIRVVRDNRNAAQPDHARAAGGGKGTRGTVRARAQCAEDLTGDILREAVHDGSLGLKAKAIMDRGELLNDDIAIGTSAIGCRVPTRGGFVLDGFRARSRRRWRSIPSSTRGVRCCGGDSGAGKGTVRRIPRAGSRYVQAHRRRVRDGGSDGTGIVARRRQRRRRAATMNALTVTDKCRLCGTLVQRVDDSGMSARAREDLRA